MSLKLSSFENEDALDILADIMLPASEIMMDKAFAKMYDSRVAPLKIIAYVLKNHKKSCVEIVSALHGETPETYKFNILSLTKDLLSMINDPELMAVFSSQGQKTEETSSGSAMETTGEKEK